MKKDERESYGTKSPLHIFLEDRYFTLHHLLDDPPREDSFSRHSHLTYELLLFVRGDAEYNCEGQIYDLRPYDLLFIPRGLFHYLHLRSCAAYERYYINFDARILPGESGERLDALPTVRNIAEKPVLRGCFEKMDGYAQRFSEADARLLLRCTLREVLLNLLYETPEVPQNDVRHNPIIDRIIARVDAAPERNWDAEMLSRELFLSKSYIQNTFSEHMDIGLKQYINTKKILYAQSLLLSGERPTEVCEACGFHDYSTFYRLFCKITGSTPSAILRGT